MKSKSEVEAEVKVKVAARKLSTNLTRDGFAYVDNWGVEARALGKWRGGVGE